MQGFSYLYPFPLWIFPLFNYKFIHIIFDTGAGEQIWAVTADLTTTRQGGAIDRKRERERRYMMQQLYKNADELATKMVQRLLDKKILEITDETAIRKLFNELFEKLSNMEEFDMLYKIAPLRQLVVDPNFLSLYVTQYICEDLVENDKVQDVYGDDLEIYQVVESVFKVLRPQD